MYSTHARALTCEVRWRGDCGCRKSVVTFSSLLQAYKRGLRYPKYQFLIFSWYSEGWLEEPGSIKKLSCTLEERIRTLDYALAVRTSDFNNNASLVTDGGLVRLTNTPFRNGWNSAIVERMFHHLQRTDFLGLSV